MIEPVFKPFVNWELEHRVFRCIDWIEGALAHWRLEFFPQKRDDHEAT